MIHILILGFTGIGNLLFFTPALKFLKQSFKCNIHLVTWEKNGNLDFFIKLNYADSIKYFKKPQNVLQNIIFLYKFIKLQYKVEFCFFPFSGIPNIKMLLISLFSNSKRKLMHWQTKYVRIFRLIFPSIVFIDIKEIHDIEQNLNLIYNITNNRYSKKDKFIELTEVDIQKWGEYYNVKRYKRISIGIHPMVKQAFDATRMWNKSNFINLAKMIKNSYSVRFYFFCVKSELDYVKSIISNIKDCECLIISDKTLYEAACIIKNLDYMIGNDSSIAHLAALLNIPTLCLMGPTNPVRTRPYGERNSFIKVKPQISAKYKLTANDLIVGTDEDLINLITPTLAFKKLELLIKKNIE